MRYLCIFYLALSANLFLSTLAGPAAEGERGEEEDAGRIALLDQLSKAFSGHPGAIPGLAMTTPHTFRQLVDHGDPSKGTFEQRYFVNRGYYRPGGAILLIVNGEAGMEPRGVFRGLATRLAERTSAALVALEHRYYGESVPAADLSGPHMRFLTVDQALADVASFVRGVKITGVEGGGRWIAYGGSYGGALAAWTRALHPGLVHAAYVSSAPVAPAIEFPGYADAVYRALPGECAAAFGRMAGYVNWALREHRSEALKRRFGLEGLPDGDFVMTMYGPLEMWTGTEGRDGRVRTEDLCRFASRGKGGDEEMIGAYAAYVKQWAGPGFARPELLSTRHQAGEIAKGAPGSDTRAWKWQTCFEMGSRRVASARTLSVYPDAMSGAYYSEQCETLFPNAGLPKMPSTLARARNSSEILRNASRILYVTSAADPWTEAAYTYAPNAEQAVLSVKTGGYHCADMAETSAADSPELMEVRDRALDIMGEWVNPPRKISMATPMATFSFNVAMTWSIALSSLYLLL